MAARSGRRCEGGAGGADAIVAAPALPAIREGWRVGAGDALIQRPFEKFLLQESDAAQGGAAARETIAGLVAGQEDKEERAKEQFLSRSRLLFLLRATPAGKGDRASCCRDSSRAREAARKITKASDARLALSPSSKRKKREIVRPSFFRLDLLSTSTSLLLFLFFSTSRMEKNALLLYKKKDGKKGTRTLSLLFLSGKEWLVGGKGKSVSLSLSP